MAGVIFSYRAELSKSKILSQKGELSMSWPVFCRLMRVTFFLFLGLIASTLPAGAEESGVVSGSLFVKLDALGNELSKDAVAWAMVKDTQKGLTWEAKTVDGSIHDATNEYTWKETKEVFLAELNRTKFGGFDDWRMPNDTEINTLMRRDQEEPYVDRAYFPNILPVTYWNFYICGSGAVMSDTKSFGKKSVRAAKHHAIAVRGREL